jgi:hypothetical protein
MCKIASFIYYSRANTEVDMINASCHLAEENFSRLTEPWPAAAVPSDWIICESFHDGVNLVKFIREEFELLRRGFKFWFISWLALNPLNWDV